MKRTFQRPNLEAKAGTGSRAFISVRSNRDTIGISQGAINRMGLEEGDYLHLALDRTGTPWIGVLPEPTGQGEPRVQFTKESGTEVSSRLLVRHLIERLDEDPGGCIRFFFDGETTEDPEIDATLYKLTTPNS